MNKFALQTQNSNRKKRQDVFIFLNVFIQAKELLERIVTINFPSNEDKHTLYLRTDTPDGGWGVALS